MTHYVKYKYGRKWGNARKQKLKGKSYDSKFEAQNAQDLEILKKAGKILGFESHKRIPLVVNDFIVCDYYVDFVIHHLDGTTEYMEVKGYPITPVWKLKWKLLEAITDSDPDITMTLVKMKKFNIRRLRKA